MDRTADLDSALDFVIGRIGAQAARSGDPLSVGCDSIAQLEENVQIARDFTPLSQSQLAALNQLAAPVAKQSLFFRFTDRSKG